MTYQAQTYQAQTYQADPTRPFRSLLAFLGAVLLCALLAACGESSRATPAQPASPAAGGAIPVVATVGMVEDLVRRVGGESFAVTTLMGPGTDPHLYKPTPADLRTLESARAIFAVGLKLEGKMEQTLEALGKAKPVVFVGAGLDQARLIPAGEEDAAAGKAVDPHVWFDVALWSQAITPVADALVTLAPAQEAAIRQRAQAYRDELLALHDEVRATLAAVPAQRRVLVTAHDAFHYLGRAYEVEVMGVQGISTESEASLRDVNALVDTLVSRQIPAIFVETSVSRKNIEALLQGAQSRGHTVRIGGELFSDAMGAAGTPEGTYPGMVRHNARTIAEALK